MRYEYKQCRIKRDGEVPAMKKREAIMISIILALAVVLPVLSEETVYQANDTAQVQDESAAQEQEQTVQDSEEETGGFGDEYLQILANDKYELYLDTSSGAFIVSDPSVGLAWYSNPKDRASDLTAKGVAKMNLSSQLLVQFIDTNDNNKTITNTYTGSVQQGGARFAKIDNGFAAIYTFPEFNVTIPVEITLQDGFVNVCVRYDSIEENGSAVVTQLTVMPYFGAGGSNEEGYLLVPDGSGAIINFNNGKHSVGNYSESVYGLDAAEYHYSMQKYTQKVTMPVFGIQSTGQGLLAIIDSGAANMTINGEVSGRRTSYNAAFTSLDVRLPIISVIGTEQVTDYPEDRIDIGDINIRYYLFAGDGGYNEMAKIYREYLISEKGMEPASDFSKMYIEIINSYNRKTSFLGFPYTKTEELTTFDETAQIAENFISQGVRDMSFILRNYNRSTVNGKLTDAGGYLWSLGGRSGFNAMKEYLESEEIGLYLMTDLIRYSKSSKLFSRSSDAVRNVNNSPAKTYDYSLSTYVADKSKPYFFLQPNKLLENVKKLIEDLTSFGVSNVAINDIANNTYADSGKESPISKTRTVDKYLEALKLMSDGKAHVLAQTANSYVFPYVSDIIAAPIESSMLCMEDESVPFYQMAISGLVSYSVPAINHSSTMDEMFLKSIETGSALYFVLAGNDGEMLEDTIYQQFYSIDPDYWTSIVAEKYEQIDQVFEHTGNKIITGHYKLGENVFRTAYENGTVVIVNYNTTDYASEYGVINAMGYLLVESED